MVVEVTGVDVISWGEHEEWAQNNAKDVTPSDKE